MPAALRRQGFALLGRLARLSSTTAASQQHQGHQQVIAAEVAQLVSLRGGLTVLPADVSAAIDEAAKGANRKAVKRRGQELSYRLRHMSRSKHRGGVHPNLSEQLAVEAAAEEEDAVAARRQRRGKRRQSRAAALEELTKAAALPVKAGEKLETEELGRLLGGSLGRRVSAEAAAQAAAEADALAARSSIAEGGSLYDTPAALAYAASRLPACYAALHHALREVAERRPSWRPATQLDFGAGPGTAVWAAQQVWPQAPLDALAVEPAGAMAWLGSEIQRAQREQHDAALARMATAQRQRAQTAGGQPGFAAAAAVDEEAGIEEGEEREALPAPPPRLRWMYKLPPRYRAAQGRQYDLVTAGYVLGELKSDAERRRLVQELWSRTSGVLLLVEPGTPAGAGHIQRARTQLLQLAAAEAAQRQGSSSSSSTSGGGGGGGAAAGASGSAGAEGAAGAHVVAPCPHDGACPLDGRASWCHFVQRFQRTQLQRAAKASAGIQPRTYQDERFSYVAIARGLRPAAHLAAAQPAVAGSFVPSFEDPQDYLRLPTHLEPRRVPVDAEPLVMYSDGEDEDEEGSDSWSETDDDVVEGGGSSSSSSSSSSSDEDSESSTSSGEESDGNSDSDGSGGEGWQTGGRGTKSLAEAQQLFGGGGAAAISAQAAETEGLDEATRRLLLQSIMDEEDEEGLGPELAAQLERELAEAAAAAARERDTAAAAAAAATQGQAGGGARGPWVLAPMSEGTIDQLMSGERVDWEEAEPGAVQAARAASGAWSRVIRTPRKRSGHVVLDLCSAAGAAGGAGARGGLTQHAQQQAQQQGVLLRQVVSRSAAQRHAGGTAAYRLARRLRWGDLWPADYQGRFRSEEPPAGQAPGQD